MNLRRTISVALNYLRMRIFAMVLLTIYVDIPWENASNQTKLKMVKDFSGPSGF